MPTTSRRWSSEVPSQEEQFEIKRKALIREAGKAFGKFGFHNTSLTSVAASLNVTKAALYYYIKDKNEILLECHHMALDLGDQALAEALTEPCSAFEKLQLYAFRYMKLMNSELGNYAVLTEPLTSLRFEAREEVQVRRRKHDTHLREWIRQGIEDGEIAPGDPAVMVAFMMGAINYIPTWFNPNGKVSGDDIANMYTRFITNAFRHDKANITPQT